MGTTKKLMTICNTEQIGKSITDQHSLFRLHRSVNSCARIIATAMKMAHQDLCWLKLSTIMCCWTIAVSQQSGRMLVVYYMWTQIWKQHLGWAQQMLWFTYTFVLFWTLAVCKTSAMFGRQILHKQLKIPQVSNGRALKLCQHLWSPAAYSTCYSILLHEWLVQHRSPWSTMTSTNCTTCTHFIIH